MFGKTSIYDRCPSPCKSGNLSCTLLGGSSRARVPWDTPRVLRRHWPMVRDIASSCPSLRPRAQGTGRVTAHIYIRIVSTDRRTELLIYIYIYIYIYVYIYMYICISLYMCCLYIRAACWGAPAGACARLVYLHLIDPNGAYVHTFTPMEGSALFLIYSVGVVGVVAVVVVLFVQKINLSGAAAWVWCPPWAAGGAPWGRRGSRGGRRGAAVGRRGPLLEKFANAVLRLRFFLFFSFCCLICQVA